MKVFGSSNSGSSCSWYRSVGSATGGSGVILANLGDLLALAIDELIGTISVPLATPLEQVGG